MSRSLSFTLLVGVASAWHMAPPTRLARVSTACHAEKPAVSRADFLSGLALGASAIAAPAFAETPRNDVTSYDKIPNQSGLQSKVIGGFAADYETLLQDISSDFSGRTLAGGGFKFVPPMPPKNHHLQHSCALALSFAEALLQ